MVHDRKQYRARGREAEAESKVLKTEPTGRNGSEPHRMSFESARTGKPSRYLNGEGRQKEPRQPSEVPQRSGGVSEDGMLGRGGEKTREISAHEGEASKDGTTSETGKAGTVAGEVGVLHSSVDLWASTTHEEPRRNSCAKANDDGKGRGDGEGEPSQGTPAELPGVWKVRELQRTLYQQARKKPKWRAWSLYGDLCRTEILAEAIRQVRENGGAPGVDGMRSEELTPEGGKEEAYLLRLQELLRKKEYRASPVLRVYIPKADGKKRPLGIPTVTDRVVQTAVVLLLEPIFEADFHEHSYAYRRRKQPTQAIDAIREAVMSGRSEVVDADLQGYFDSIPHSELMKLVSQRVSDGTILKLIKGWLTATIIEEDPGSGRPQKRRNRQGTPQGGVISPLLANLYLDGLDKAVNGGQQLKAKMIRFADDFVVCCYPGKGLEMLRRLKIWLAKRKLKLNETKTRIVDYRETCFEFLSFRISKRKSCRGKDYPHVEPSPKSQKKLREAIREEMNRSTLWKDPLEVVSRVNRRVRGWANYFHYGNSTKVFAKMDRYLVEKTRRWLWRKYGQTQALYGEAYTKERLQQNFGLYQFPLYAKWRKSNA